MPVIPTIRLLFIIWTNAPFLLHYYRGLERYYNLIFAGKKFRGRKISQNSIRSGFYFRGRKISRKIQIREYSENFFHAKNWCYTVFWNAIDFCRLYTSKKISMWALPTVPLFAGKSRFFYAKCPSKNILQVGRSGVV